MIVNTILLHFPQKGAVFKSPKRQIFNSSKLKESAEEHFKFDENGGKFSKRVENTVGKGEIARRKQLLLFPQCFQKDFYLRHVKTMGLVWEGANTLPNEYMLATSKLKAFADNKRNAAEMIISVLDTVENIVGKEENAGYQHFLLFPQSFPKASFSGLLKVGIV